MKELFVITSLLIVSVGSLAASPDRIQMKDGTIYEGYIAEQFPDGRIEIETVAEVRTIEKVGGVSVENRGGKLCVSTPDAVFEDVIFLEEGDWLTFRISRKSLISSVLSEVEAIISPVPDTLVQRKVLQDVIETKDGSIYRGTISELCPGRLMKIVTEGKVVVLNQGSIRAQGRQQGSPTQSIWDQSPYINTFFFRNGTSLDGVLVHQDYESGRLNIVTQEGIEHERNARDLVRNKKKPNPQFKLRTPIVVLSNEIYVNGKQFLPLTFTRKTETVSLPTELFKFQPVDNEDLEIVMNKIEGSTPLLLPLPAASKRAEGKRVQVFNLIDAIGAYIAPMATIPESEQQITLRYENLKSGNYVFYNPVVDTGLLLNIL